MSEHVCPACGSALKPTRGALINAKASAGAALVEARERLARTPERKAADYERARVVVLGAEQRLKDAEAALAAWRETT